MKPSLALGLDLGGTNVVAALVDPKGRMLAVSKRPTLAAQGPASVIGRMAAQSLELLKEAGVPRSAVLGLGIGSPGPLNAHTGVVTATPNLPGWRNVPLTRLLTKKTGLKARLGNDAGAATLGEAAFGAGRGCKDLLMLTLGTGVGGGLFLGGKLHVGQDTTAGELGHISLDPHGPACGCGQRGCLEQYASATAIARRARQLASRARRGPLWKLCAGRPSQISAKMAHQALQLGDPSAKAAFAEAAWALGTAMAGYINIFNPQRVVLAGGVMLGGRELLRDASRIAKARAFPEPARRVRILKSSLGDYAGVLGASLLARPHAP